MPVWAKYITKKVVFMKKMAAGLIFVALMVSCAKTGVNAQSNDDLQRIVGTWAGVDGDNDPLNGTLVFNADGTCSGLLTGKYFFSNSVLCIRGENEVRVVGFYFSPDGKTLVLTGAGSFSPWWLEKQ
jgi:hypothetical protein